jgi:DNA-binding NtrC family response regulator
MADGGTALDEIMICVFQVKLLRFLGKEFSVGGTSGGYPHHRRHQRSLKLECQAGRFREDL